MLERSRAFSALWQSQLFAKSLSAISGFVLGYLLYEATKDPSVLAYALFCRFLPSAICSFLAGVLVDRFNKLSILRICQVWLSINPLMMLFIIGEGSLQLHVPLLYSLLAMAGIVDGFKSVCFQSIPPTLVERSEYQRANGRLILLDAVPPVIGPVLSVPMLSYIGVSGIFGLDAISSLCALFVLGRIVISKEGSPLTKVRMAQLWEGIRFILTRGSLSSLLVVFACFNAFNGLAAGVFVAYILSVTNSKETLAAVQTIFAIGLALGSISASSKLLRRLGIGSILLGMGVAAITGRLLLGLSISPMFWAVGLFIREFTIPVVNAISLRLWQEETPMSMQGRVFGARRFFVLFLYPLALGSGGYIVTNVLTKERLQNIGWLTKFTEFNPAFNIASLILVAGVLEILAILFVYLYFERRRWSSSSRIADIQGKRS